MDENNWVASAYDPAARGPFAPAYKIDAKVPGDLVSDLQRAGLIRDPLYELNFLNSSLWHDYTWVYSTTFLLQQSAERNGHLLLVFDGIKMGAHVRVNGHLMGTVYNQFRRYEFDLNNTVLLDGAAQTLEVEFDGSISMVGNRFSACTGGWVSTAQSSAPSCKPALVSVSSCVFLAVC